MNITDLLFKAVVHGPVAHVPSHAWVDGNHAYTCMKDLTENHSNKDKTQPHRVLWDRGKRQRKQRVTGKEKEDKEKEKPINESNIFQTKKLEKIKTNISCRVRLVLLDHHKCACEFTCFYSIYY